VWPPCKEPQQANPAALKNHMSKVPWGLPEKVN
jgi:hypothetical protein